MIFMPFPRFVAPIPAPPPLAITNVASMKHSSSSSAPLSRSSLSNIRQQAPQNLIAAPSLKAPMYRFVVGIALRQHVPLRACVENPQYRFKHTTRRSRFAPRTSIANILLRKMIPDAFPLLVREQNHSSFISDRQQSAILR